MSILLFRYDPCRLGNQLSSPEWTILGVTTADFAGICLGVISRFVIYHFVIMATSNSPLTPPAFFVLFALADGDKHGYGIMRDIRKLSNETVNLGPATLYTTIQRLLDRRWIREVPSPDGSDIRRRYYRLTSEGRLVFSGELKRMEFIVKKSKAMRLRPSELC